MRVKYCFKISSYWKIYYRAR